MNDHRTNARLSRTPRSGFEGARTRVEDQPAVRSSPSSGRYRLAVVGIVAALVLFTGACGSSADEDAADDRSVAKAEDSDSGDGGDAEPGIGEDAPVDASEADAPEVFADDEADDGESDESMDDVEAMEDEEALDIAPDAESARQDAAEIDRQVQENPLRAGSVDDNDRWDDYLEYRAHFTASGGSALSFDVEDRRLIRVVDEQGQPVHGARIAIEDGDGNELASLRTYADGRAAFYPAAVQLGRPDGQERSGSGRFLGVVEKDGVRSKFVLDEQTISQDVTLAVGAGQGLVKLDLAFLIDATGSMSDEIVQLKSNMISVAQKLDRLPENPDVRYSVTAYRDFGDEYVTRSTEFTADLDRFVRDFRAIEADGGGDLPEALNEGLHETVTLPSWRVDDTVSIVVLVGDAPPHLDQSGGPEYPDDLVTAQGLGIKIFPVASSGIDDRGEFVFRQLAQATQGRFVFLTYGADGSSPGDATDHHVDDYSVLALDDLVVRLVSEELSLLRT